MAPKTPRAALPQSKSQWPWNNDPELRPSAQQQINHDSDHGPVTYWW